MHGDELIDLEVDGEAITTTEDHPFWNHTDQSWQAAQDLDSGDLILTADGDHLPVDGLDPNTTQHGFAYNLTVNDIHTYYVTVGDEEALVHNDCGPLGAGGTQTTSNTLLKPRGRSFRIDVENPAPGVRPGQLHLQSGGQKYLYDFNANQFTGLPGSLARQVANDPAVAVPSLRVASTLTCRDGCCA